MYDAYAKIDVAKSITDITSLSAHCKFILPYMKFGCLCLAVSDTVYAGLKAGSLLCFKRPNDPNRRGHVSQVFREFEHKAVRDLQFLEPLELILCLSDDKVKVHSSKEQFEVIAVVDKYPSITAFSGYVKKVCLLFI